MKHISLPFLLMFFISCNQQSATISQLKNQVDSLQHEVNSAYKPGLGEFMSDIQVHHEKLWFAGTNNNWKLADFEVHEIKESLDDIKQYCTDRPEVKYIGMIDQPLDSVISDIQQQDLTKFKGSFILLTNTCNSCHHETNHGFNVIKIPDTPPFSNQDFKKTN
jgi:hypothetical protein